MATKKKEVVEPTQDASHQLVSALIQAIQATKPIEKKTVASFKSRGAFNPDGSPRPKLKRKSYHHGVLLNKDNGKEVLTNEEIELFNKIRPGVYCDGDIKVIRRRDRGIDIDYPIKTASQRMKIINNHGIRSFKELLERLILEAENPQNYKKVEDDDF